MEELCFLLLVDMSDANFCCDSNIVFALLDQQVKATMARPHFMCKKNNKDQDGRVIFLTLNSFLEGANACSWQICKAEEAIQRLVWSYSFKFPPESFTSTSLYVYETSQQIGGERCGLG
mmetsp:Transcript_20756/g.31724  ORF Transcript_20756/g.31724 Transcript_20756/m.31724 type:complete len:119 (+) Transcript_20756:737-1093(+)